MTTKHKHYDVIIAYANGEAIQWFNPSAEKWEATTAPSFMDIYQYRVKPKHQVVYSVQFFDAKGRASTIVCNFETKAEAVVKAQSLLPNCYGDYSKAVILEVTYSSENIFMNASCVYVVEKKISKGTKDYD
jgi:hypothetical protein